MGKPNSLLKLNCSFHTASFAVRTLSDRATNHFSKNSELISVHFDPKRLYRNRYFQSSYNLGPLLKSSRLRWLICNTDGLTGVGLFPAQQSRVLCYIHL